MRYTIGRLALVVVLLAGSAACGHPNQTPATPRAAALIRADDVVLRVNELQATIIEWCAAGTGATCQPGTIDTALARRLVSACLDVRRVARSAVDGWPAAVRTAWATAKTKFAGIANPLVVAAVAAVDALIGGLL